MSGLYLHIPFCRQACAYCDFHFSTNTGLKSPMIQAMKQEMALRAPALRAPLATVYFGGGTPSLLSAAEINELMDEIHRFWRVEPGAEITLEANPDDLTPEFFSALKDTPVNRLSIGIQSFDQNHLLSMNRAHNASQALSALEGAAAQYIDFSLDLIYGIPGMTVEQWAQHIQRALSFRPTHVSAYALTQEPKTLMDHEIKKGVRPALSEALAADHFDVLVQSMEQGGYAHYEISNFARDGYYARNNTAYWQGKPYVGIGPSAHSFDGFSRSWNVSNNPQYIKSLSQGITPQTVEVLTEADRYNELVMTGLRTIWGVDPQSLPGALRPYFAEVTQPLLAQGVLQNKGGQLALAPDQWFKADGWAAALFYVADASTK